MNKVYYVLIWDYVNEKKICSLKCKVVEDFEFVSLRELYIV